MRRSRQVSNGPARQLIVCILVVGAGALSGVGCRVKEESPSTAVGQGSTLAEAGGSEEETLATGCKVTRGIRVVREGVSAPYPALEVSGTISLGTSSTNMVVCELYKGEEHITSRASRHATIYERAIVTGGPGEHAFRVKMSGQDIRDTGLDGPYDVRLVVLDYRGTVIEERTVQTRAYAYREFGEAATDKDL